MVSARLFQIYENCSIKINTFLIKSKKYSVVSNNIFSQQVP